MIAPQYRTTGTVLNRSLPLQRAWPRPCYIYTSSPLAGRHPRFTYTYQHRPSRPAARPGQGPASLQAVGALPFTSLYFIGSLMSPGPPCSAPWPRACSSASCRSTTGRQCCGPPAQRRSAGPNSPSSWRWRRTVRIGDGMRAHKCVFVWTGTGPCMGAPAMDGNGPLPRPHTPLTNPNPILDHPITSWVFGARQTQFHAVVCTRVTTTSTLGPLPTLSHPTVTPFPTPRAMLQAFARATSLTVSWPHAPSRSCARRRAGGRRWGLGEAVGGMPVLQPISRTEEWKAMLFCITILLLRLAAFTKCEQVESPCYARAMVLETLPNWATRCIHTAQKPLAPSANPLAGASLTPYMVSSRARWQVAAAVPSLVAPLKLCANTMQPELVGGMLLLLQRWARVCSSMCYSMLFGVHMCADTLRAELVWHMLLQTGGRVCISTVGGGGRGLKQHADPLAIRLPSLPPPMARCPVVLFGSHYTVPPAPQPAPLPPRRCPRPRVCISMCISSPSPSLPPTACCAATPALPPPWRPTCATCCPAWRCSGRTGGPCCCPRRTACRRQAPSQVRA